MKSEKKMRLPLVLAALLCIVSELTIAQDVRGSADHPLLSRYPGSYIKAYRSFDFEEFKLAVGLRQEQQLTAVTKTFSGKAMSIVYEVGGDHSARQIFRNYEQALQKAGMEVLFSCFNKECGNSLPVALFRSTSREPAYRAMRYDSIHMGNADFGYISATGQHNGAPVAVGVYVGRLRIAKTTGVGVDIVESEAMKSDLIAVSAESLKKDIAAHGKAVLEGLYFDTNKASVKPESKQALDSIGSFLKQNEAAYFVVGHTDTVGSFEHNLELSKRRAQAVVDELTRSHGIAPKRLHSQGVGPVAPTHSNENETGRARNRRVELVLNPK